MLQKKNAFTSALSYFELMLMATPLAALAELCERLESTNARNSMVSWVASFIHQLEAKEIGASVLILMGRVLPDYDQRVLEVSWRTISRIILKTANKNARSFTQAFSKTGDVGEATKMVLQDGKTGHQSTLFRKKLTILEAYRTFEEISNIKGTGSRSKKERLLETLLGSATPEEAKYIVKALMGEMRLGFQEGLMEQAVAEAFSLPLELVQTASMLTGDISEVAVIAKKQGKKGLSKINLAIFRPIKPMMAQVASNIAEVFQKHGEKAAFEYKLDGARIQIHKSGSEVKIFSRRLTNVTDSLPEVVELVRSQVGTATAVLEGEVIAVNENGTPMLFQHLMRRFRRTRRIKETAEKIPIKLYLFDVMFVNGENLLTKSYSIRRKRLAKVAGEILLTKQIIADNVETGEKFLKEASEAGHEGVMAKKLDSYYTPGIRGKKWLKVKTTLEPLDLIIVAAEYGYGRRHGWLSNYLLAARDAETGELVPLGKTFKGLTDDEIIKMTRELKRLTLGKEGHRILVKPKIVVEVAYNEIQRSPKYKGGMALRFARITRIRQDKDPEDADTIERVTKIYERQFEKKARYNDS